jgi:hypothetical protein
MARRRGAIAGPLLILLGAWGALVPFIGHSFGFGFTPDNTWTWTAPRGWLEVLPGAGAMVGGALLTVTNHRAIALLSGWLAAVSGAWFALGTVVSPWWSAGFIGTPSGDATRGVWEQICMFTGLGLVIACLAGIAIGRATVVGLRDLSSGQERLDAYRRIEDAPAYSYYSTPHSTGTIDLTAAEEDRLGRDRRIRDQQQLTHAATHDSPR